jgi:hypothetical protein
VPEKVVSPCRHERVVALYIAAAQFVDGFIDQYRFLHGASASISTRYVDF